MSQRYGMYAVCFNSGSFLAVENSGTLGTNEYGKIAVFTNEADAFSALEKWGASAVIVLSEPRMTDREFLTAKRQAKEIDKRFAGQ